MEVLGRNFFEQPTLDVAQSLIGKGLVLGDRLGIITETEAYFGDDPASHGARGKTERNFPMFGLAGYSYVYFIYGMYHCLNFTTEAKGFPAAVLIRGVRMLDTGELFDGPGKLCRDLGITREHSNIDLCESDELYLVDLGFEFDVHRDKRVGISKNKEKEWRFVASL